MGQRSNFPSLVALHSNTGPSIAVASYSFVGHAFVVMAKTFKRGDHVAWNSEAGEFVGLSLRKLFPMYGLKAMSTMPRKTHPNTSSKVTKPSTSQFTKGLLCDF